MSASADFLLADRVWAETVSCGGEIFFFKGGIAIAFAQLDKNARTSEGALSLLRRNVKISTFSGFRLRCFCLRCPFFWLVSGRCGGEKILKKQKNMEHECFEVWL